MHQEFSLELEKYVWNFSLSMSKGFCCCCKVLEDHSDGLRKSTFNKNTDITEIDRLIARTCATCINNNKR